MAGSKSQHKLSIEQNDENFEFNRFDKKFLENGKNMKLQSTNNFNEIKPSTPSSTSTTDYTSTLDPEMDYANISKYVLFDSLRIRLYNIPPTNKSKHIMLIVTMSFDNFISEMQGYK